MRRTIYNPESMRQKAAAWLREGISPRRLALTLALGFVLGCIPLVGVPTGLCIVLALVFRLNVPAIQAANYVAMPFQLALAVPLMRLGARLTPGTSATLDVPAMMQSPWEMLQHSSGPVAAQLGVMAGQALLGWLLLALPVLVLMTLTLTGVLRRVPALAESRARR
jgi:uncharacterized protein (DUF2062 family)